MSAESQTADKPNGAPPPEDKGLEKRKAREPQAGDNATAMDFSSGENFALLQRVAKMLSESDLLPERYRGKIGNCAIALNMAGRLGADPLMVTQNLYVVKGKPGWSAKFLIATLNQNGGFSKLRYEWTGQEGTPEWGCRAWATEKATGDRLDGPWITWKLANAEGWVNKDGSKWKTMPLKMFMYRAAAWFVDVYAPEISMGLQTREELDDVIDLTPTGDGGYGFQEVTDPAAETATKPNGATKADGLAEQLKRQRESRSPAPEVPTEPAASSTSSEAQEEATGASAKEDTTDDGGMSDEDDLRATAQALYDKVSKTAGKVARSRETLKKFGVATVKEITAENLSGFIDAMNSILEG